MRRTTVIFAATWLGTWVSMAGMPWTHLANDAAHSGQATRAPRALGSVAWVAPPVVSATELEEFVWRSSPVVADGRAFVTARRYVDDGTGLWEHVANVVVCYDAEDGTRLWDTDVDADLSGQDSWASAAVDRTTGTVIVASHYTVYGLAVADGQIMWECPLPVVLANASPTVTDDLVHGGAAANRVFITDYTGYTPSGGGVYAINVSPYDAGGNPYQPGEIVWQDRTLPGTSGNTVAYAGGVVYVSSTHGGTIRCYAALDGGAPGTAAVPEWEADTGLSQVSAYAGFYSGVAVRGGYVYAAGYNFYGSGDSSRLYKVDAGDGTVIWEVPCGRTNSIPVVSDGGRIYLAAGIEGFGSAVTVQAFADHGLVATKLWDTFDDTGGSLVLGGWTHQPLLVGDRLYCGTPDEMQFYGPHTDLYILDTTLTPGDPGFVVEQAAGSGGSPATTGRYLYSLGSEGLVAYRGCGAGDMDADGDVDGADFGLWDACLAGPDVIVPPPDCDAETFSCADVDGDEDVDVRDFAQMQRNVE